ncbi:protein PTST, chloroplastic-like isoform X1 [Prosopis cineraria]|uniref:protein PTST, chloroplastic-like isoform X1 n=1 Tax=Prosopis cineraria TaxID=364024 RepID=UPI00240FB523|nr:protein PTST, chloroplastic-like isoform X1 [Prosopis cineraria]XP_054794958.1 protein PTST, chloroplastic-like isoform X1 [Prosopis cineraria]XP_054794965.1 protein PTST, chloroplastic-like isoform X1 [Prosopis cineraria]XP_054794973.1 protein PTST, chloroplastic-like isoform X1 [Prosopis cineraria]
MEISTARCCLDSQPQAILFSRISRTSGWESTHRISYNMTALSLRLGYRGLASSYPISILNAVYPNRPCFHRAHSMATSLDESTWLQSEGDSDEDEDASEDSTEKILEQPLTSEQIAALLADTERARLTKKLSEANQHNRFLKRQLQIKEESLVNFKSELAVMELEVQALVKLAEEIAQSAIPGGSRKIKGKYIQSHLVSRLEAVHEKLKEQIKDVDSVQSKEVPVFWVGMAESVQVMGSFDGWSQGEYLSPEYDGSYTKFSSTLMLRPGRYEIKFLVDGEWQLSPEFPTIGGGLTKNNLLVVE